MTKADYDAYNLMNVSEYRGQWVAIVNKKVVSFGKDLKKVHSEAKKISPKLKPLFAKVPAEDTIIL